MELISVNIAKEQNIEWKGKSIKTGIYKKPVLEPIYLGFTDVKNDNVIDRKHHGGIDKACYAYSADAYNYWAGLFPDKNFETGFFGENLTISNLNENNIRIGSRYKVGSAIIEVSQPRQPCNKLGIRFGSQSFLKTFIKSPHPGIYFRVLKEGKANTNDKLELIFEDINEPTVLQVFRMIFGLEKDATQIQNALNSKHLASAATQAIVKHNKGLIS